MEGFFPFFFQFLKAKAQWDISYFHLHMNTQNSLSICSYSRALALPDCIWGLEWSGSVRLLQTERRNKGPRFAAKTENLFAKYLFISE